VSTAARSSAGTPGPATTEVRSVGRRSGPQDRLRRATEVLREGVDTGQEWRDQDVSEVARALAEHLLAIADTLPSNEPAWIVSWQRLMRRHGAVGRPLAEEQPGSGVDALIRLKARLELVADLAEQSAARAGRDQ
jgi:hypothetical protein